MQVNLRIFKQYLPPTPHADTDKILLAFVLPSATASGGCFARLRPVVCKSPFQSVKVCFNGTAEKKNEARLRRMKHLPAADMKRP